MWHENSSSLSGKLSKQFLHVGKFCLNHNLQRRSHKKRCVVVFDFIQTDFVYLASEKLKGTDRGWNTEGFFWLLISFTHGWSETNWVTDRARVLWLGAKHTAWRWKRTAALLVKGWRDIFGRQVRESSRGLVGYSLCMHSPSVQFLDWSTMPSQSFPPFLGAGALHSLLLQWVHSVPQVDHLLHSVHRPSTITQQTGQTGVEWTKRANGEMKTNERVSGRVHTWSRQRE